ncbi:MAG: tautomerase family protein [Propionibacteriaceae bacterium]|jgi:phenylpyruvate tautomerase PptA (4-oxalocrotonate tautomerase family)|nr:tautomerase family protein [Propionibacteriaceae bacterium]
MPYVHARVGRAITDPERAALADRIGRMIETLPGKSFAKTMVHIEDDDRIHRGGQRTPSVFIETQVRRPNDLAAKQAYASGLFAVCQEVLDVPPDQVYLTIVEVDHWGSKGEFR